MFLNNRYHDPTLGTFISVDPLVAKTGEAYIYASGNPTTLSDPTGLEPGCGLTAYSARSCGQAHAYASQVAHYNEATKSKGKDGVAEVIACSLDCARHNGGTWSGPGYYSEAEVTYADPCRNWGCAIAGPVTAAAGALMLLGAAYVGGAAYGCANLWAICSTTLAPAVAGGANVVNEAHGGPGAGSTIWSSTDDLVGPAANALERAMPGRVVGVNRNVPLTTRSGYREIDVLLEGVYVQVKGGGGGRIAAQVQRTMETTGVPTVGYAPGMSNMAWEQAARSGVPIARSLDELVVLVRELAG